MAHPEIISVFFFLLTSKFCIQTHFEPMTHTENPKLLHVVLIDFMVKEGIGKLL